MPPLDTSIVPGSVYYFHDARLSSTQSHYFVVLNKNPLTDSVLLLVCSTSRVDSARSRRHLRRETLVEVSPAEYSEFTVQSMFDCNTVFDLSLSELQRKYDAGRLRVKLNIGASILEKLRDAVIESDLVEEEIKDILIL